MLRSPKDLGGTTAPEVQVVDPKTLVTVSALDLRDGHPRQPPDDPALERTRGAAFSLLSSASLSYRVRGTP